jgi:transcriptional regulator with XRE-family HTH domain
MTIQPMQPLGQRLYQWRLANKWTQADVALELGRSISAINNIEQGTMMPGRLTCAAIEALMARQTISVQLLTEDERLMVERVVNAVRAGLVVSLIRPATAECGQVAVTFGDEDWKKWI